ncbi:unnamed protein product [Nippostrongylus brasiliensis]|uniref:Uncharacterized protein n=1 Tax=Nippostrongylus brasiliensis TaxID=27835 RepID=A0A0N4Y5N4_NIPBR|nr:unnamed protein product [Nippostrongylus brasiliensis]
MDIGQNHRNDDTANGNGDHGCRTDHDGYQTLLERRHSTHRITARLEPILGGKSRIVAPGKALHGQCFSSDSHPSTISARQM